MTDRAGQLNLRQIEVFAKTREVGSFSRAASELSISQPTVSAHIRALEEELGVVLFDRQHRGVRVTAAGERFYVHARRLLEERDRAVAAVLAVDGGLAGEFELAASSIPGAYLLPPLLRAFADRHPAVRVHLRLADSMDVLGLVRDGVCDVGFVGAEPDPDPFEAHLAGHDRLVLVAAPDHPLAGKTISPPRLAGERFVLRAGGSGSRRAAEGALPEDVAYAIVPALEVGTNEAVREAVKAGIGLAFVSDLAVRDDVDHGTLARVRLRGLSIKRPFWRVTRRGRDLTEIARAFLSESETSD